MDQPLTCISVGSDGTVFGIDAQSNILQAAPAPIWTSVPGQAQAIGAAADGTVFAKDTSGDTVQFDAATNSWPVLVSGSTIVGEISAGNSQNIWGVNGAVFAQQTSDNVYKYSASSWNLMSGIVLEHISASSDGSVTGLDVNSQVQQYDSSSQSWSPLSVQPPELLSTLSAGSATWIWGVGPEPSFTVYQYDSTGQQWLTVPGTILMANVSCGDDGTVWGVGQDENAYYYDLILGDWTPAGSLPSGSSNSVLQVSVGNSQNIWCLDSNYNIYQYTAGQYDWTTVQAKSGWTQLSVGGASNIWGTDETNVYQVTGGAASWTPTQTIPFALQMVSVGDDGTVWGVGAGLVYQYVGGSFVAVAFSSAPLVSAPSSRTPYAVEVSVGDANHIWLIDNEPSNNGYQYTGAGWTQIPGPFLSCISAASDGSVWGVSGGNACIFYGEPDGWIQTPTPFQQISTGGCAIVWGIDANGNAVNTNYQPAEGSAEAQGSGSRERWETSDAWDETESTHLWIVNRGAMLANLATGSDQAAGSMIYELIKPSPSASGPLGDFFHDNLCQGIYDADYLPQYNNNNWPISLVFAMYKSHFYDPDTGENYKGETSPTALTQSCQYYSRAVAYYLDNDMENAGYNLGLALHYFTDVTQPMHSSNFTYVDSDPWGYHVDFERYIMRRQASVSMPAAYVPDPTLGPSPSDYLIHAATQSKLRYAGTVCPPDERPYRGNKNLGSILVTMMPQMLTDGIIFVSQYLVQWMTTASSEQVAGCFFINAADGLAMDSNSPNHAVADKQLEQNLWNNDTSQRFLLQALSGADVGYWSITALGNGRVLDLVQIPSPSQTAVVARPWGAASAPDTQKWALFDHGNGVTYIQNKSQPSAKTAISIVDYKSGSGLVETPFTATTDPADYTPAQSWLVVPTGSVYKMVFVGGPNLVADMQGGSTSAGTPLQAHSPNLTAAQEFLWVHLPGEDEYCAIVVACSGLPLWIVPVGTGYQIQQAAWSPSTKTGDLMKWAMEVNPNSANEVCIRNKSTGLYMSADLTAASPLVGAQPSGSTFTFNQQATSSNPSGTPISFGQAASGAAAAS